MIKGYCYTTLDGFLNCEWPTMFVAVPRIGECVASVDGAVDGERWLHVVKVTHGLRSAPTVGYEPYIRVELNRAR